MLQKYRNITAYFSNSFKDTNVLQQKQIRTGVLQLCLPDVNMCWNSTCAMLECLVEQRRPLDAELFANHIQANGWITPQEWMIISQTVEVLQTFNNFRERLLSDTASLVLVIPMVHLARQDLATFLEPCKEER